MVCRSLHGSLFIPIDFEAGFCALRPCIRPYGMQSVLTEEAHTLAHPA